MNSSMVSRESSPLKKSMASSSGARGIKEENNMGGDIEYDEMTIDVREQDNNSDIE